ncbi:MAG: hypothetical protein GY855_02245 [candidate division Zixibacteria bacterium]|nr:hypothetical protein [candidate division Zixibacteria bacterium]
MLIRSIKFVSGLILLSLGVIFFSSGLFPPGIAGDVLRHNKACDIDASPLFYTEVENMTELEDGIRLMKEKAEKRKK